MIYKFFQEIEVQPRRTISLAKKKYRFNQEIEVQPRGNKSFAKVSKGLGVSL